MRLLALCAVVAAAALAGTAEPAHACSCAVLDPRAMLTSSDGAFVGTVVGRRDESAAGATLIFDVEEAFKGAIGDTVEVRTPSNSAACGIEAPVGTRIGLFLERDGPRWTGTLCSQVEPARLREAARPLPPPSGKGPVALLVAGRFGPVRTIALDRTGRTLAYGTGAGSVIAFSPCSGGRRVVELVRTDAGGFAVAVRELRSLRQVRRQPVTAPGGAFPTTVRCTRPDGREAIVFLSSTEGSGRGRLVRLGPGGAAVLWRGTAPSASLTDRVAYVNAGRTGATLLAVDLRTRAVRRLGRIPAFTGPLVPDARGTRLAGVADDQRTASPVSRVVVVALGARRAVVRTAALRNAEAAGDVFWLGRGRLAFFPRFGSDDIRVYDGALRLVARLRGWQAQQTALVGATAYGVGFADGRLVRAALPRGPIREVRRLPGPVAYGIVSAGP
ncbi:MAG TPA: hypothetical protein VH572_06305 [Gaiella sp.]|jgi:hypothetical protein